MLFSSHPAPVVQFKAADGAWFFVNNILNFYDAGASLFSGPNVSCLLCQGSWIRHAGVMEKETELKLRLPPDQVDRFRRHPIIQELKLERARAKRLVSTYYDTPDMALHSKRLSLRLRKSDAKIVQTIKSLTPASGAIHVRNEWEQVVAGPNPKLADFPIKKLNKRFKSGGDDSTVSAVFTTDLKRTAWQLHNGDARIELALDLGEIRTPDGATEQVCEVEMELKEGDKNSLLDLALAFNERIDFMLEARSKSDRGYALICKEPATPQKSDPVVLHRGMTALEAYIAIAENCWVQLRSNELAARSGEDPEGIHQARVAVRRLRAATRAFKPILPEVKRRAFSAELKWLQNALGAARDWDVFIHETLAPIARQVPDDQRLQALIRLAEDRRRHAYDHARHALQGRRYGHLGLAFQSWLLNIDTSEPDSLRQPVEQFAATATGRAVKRLIKSGRDVENLDNTGLHDLRVQGKKARYCIEFFSALFPPKHVKRHLQALKQLQDCLGQINDAAVASELVLAIDTKKQLRHHRVAGLITGWHAAQARASRAKLTTIWPGIISTRKYWANL